MKLHRTLIRLGGVHPFTVSGNVKAWDHRKAVRLPERAVQFIHMHNLDTGDYIFAHVNIDAVRESDLEITEPFEAAPKMQIEELRALSAVLCGHGVNG